MEKDHISNMPEGIIHEILDRVTMQDVARTSCVSKALEGFCVSFPILNFDQQDFGHLHCAQFKSIMGDKVRSMIQEQGFVIFKFRLCLDLKYVRKALRDIQRCVRLVTKTNTVKEFDFQIMKNHFFRGNWDTFFGCIYNAESLTVLRLSGLKIVEPSRDIKFSKLLLLRLEDVMINQESIIGQFFTSCPMITEIRLVRCDGLKHLKVRELAHLKRLEVGFCPRLESVEIQAQGLEKLVLSEIKRKTFDEEFYLGLSIESRTCETLRELTLCNSSLKGITFSRMFSRCSNVESLVLDRCVHFYRITITSQKLRRLVVRRCFSLVKTEITAPNLTSFSFCNFLPPTYYCDDDSCPFSLVQYCEEVSHLQDCMLDFTQTLYTKNIWISLWCDKFKDSAGQKMAIYPKFGRYDVVVLEDWSSIAELSLMSKISEAASRTIVTNMSFIDLAAYVFGDTGKELEHVLAMSLTDGSKLYEVLKKKPKISCERCSSMIVAEKVGAFSFRGSSSDERIIDVHFFHKAIVEAGKTATLKATSLFVSSNSEVLNRKMNM